MYQAKILAITEYWSQVGPVDKGKYVYQQGGRLERVEHNSHPKVKTPSAIEGYDYLKQELKMER